jgi:hypothetical protein
MVFTSIQHDFIRMLGGILGGKPRLIQSNFSGFRYRFPYGLKSDIQSNDGMPPYPSIDGLARII